MSRRRKKARRLRVLCARAMARLPLDALACSLARSFACLLARFVPPHFSRRPPPPLDTATNRLLAATAATAAAAAAPARALALIRQQRITVIINEATADGRKKLIQT